MAAPSRHPSPAVQMRRMLASKRSHGIEFAVAWEKSWRRVGWPHDTAHRRQWKLALEETRAAWQAAYESRPDPVEGAFDALELAPV